MKKRDLLVVFGVGISIALAIFNGCKKQSDLIDSNNKSNIREGDDEGGGDGSVCCNGITTI